MKLALLLLSLSSYAQSNKLLLHFTNQKSIKKQEIVILSNDNIKSGDVSDHLKALSYYYLGVYATQDDLLGQAYTHYENAKLYSLKADSSDFALIYSIYYNQAYITKNVGLYSESINLYKEALPYSIMYDKVLEKHREVLGENTYYKGVNEMNVLYGLALALKSSSENHGDCLKTLYTLNIKAKNNGNFNYESKSNRQIGLLNLKAEKYKTAISYFKDAIDINTSTSNKALAYFNWSTVYFYTQDYKKQEEILKKSLGLYPKFIVKMALGECLMKQGKNKEAKAILLQLEKDYDHQSIHPDNAQIYEWLAMVEEDLAQKVYYTERALHETQKIVGKQKHIEAQIANYAMVNAIEAIKRQKEEAKTVAMWQNIGVAVGSFILLMIGLVWYMNQQKKRVKVYLNDAFIK